MEFKFGKFSGLSMSDPKVDLEYLNWIIETQGETVQAAQAEIVRRRQVEAKDTNWAREIISEGFHSLMATQMDGSAEQVELRGAKAALEDMIERYYAVKPEVNLHVMKPKKKKRA